MNTQESIQELQQLEQQIQQLLVQKQALQSQLIEFESASDELGNSDESWKVIGNIMVKKKPEDLLADLEEKKKVLALRIESIEKQENKLREQAQEKQSAVMKEMKDERGRNDK